MLLDFQNEISLYCPFSYHLKMISYVDYILSLAIFQ
ncbi:hypothetical protein PT2222_140391 [Paraburkholderia tropica]